MSKGKEARKESRSRGKKAASKEKEAGGELFMFSHFQCTSLYYAI